MNTLSIDTNNIIDSYVPILGMINDKTTKEQVIELVNQRSNAWKDKVKYLEFPINHEYYIKVGIACNEYIVEMSRISIEDGGIYGTWKHSQDVDKREGHNLPSVDSIFGSVRMRYDHNIDISSYKDGNAHIYSILDGKYTRLTTISTKEWFQFLDGDLVPEVEKYITRREFLDGKIIEAIAGTDRDGYTDTYFHILGIFEKLYKMGYWTYDGFKRSTIKY